MNLVFVRDSIAQNQKRSIKVKKSSSQVPRFLKSTRKETCANHPKIEYNKIIEKVWKSNCVAYENILPWDSWTSEIFIKMFPWNPVILLNQQHPTSSPTPLKTSITLILNGKLWSYFTKVIYHMFLWYHMFTASVGSSMNVHTLF